jgi:hypothetical protein
MGGTRMLDRHGMRAQFTLPSLAPAGIRASPFRDRLYPARAATLHMRERTMRAFVLTVLWEKSCAL